MSRRTPHGLEMLMQILVSIIGQYQAMQKRKQLIKSQLKTKNTNHTAILGVAHLREQIKQINSRHVVKKKNPQGQHSKSQGPMISSCSKKQTNNKNKTKQ